MQFLTILVDSIRESLARKIFWIVLGGLMIVVIAMASMSIQEDRLSIGFGWTEVDAGRLNPDLAGSRDRVVGVFVHFLVAWIVGFLAMILMLIATADTFPALMQPGAIEVVLSKPISRWRYFLYKYIASMVFVTLHATIFVVLTFLVMGLRWQAWAPRYLLAIPALVLFFGFLYCITVLAGVRTRSTVAAILITLGCWFLFWMTGTARVMVETYPSIRQNTTLRTSVAVAYWVFPKTSEFSEFAAAWTGASPSGDLVTVESDASSDAVVDATAVDQLERRRMREIRRNPWPFLGSSLAFEAVLVLLAMWRFCRQDF